MSSSFNKEMELVKAMIRRRVAKHKKINESKLNQSPIDLLEEFIKNFDDALMKSKGVHEKYRLIIDEHNYLHEKLSKLDPGCELDLRWHGDDISNIRLEGIKLTWSEDYAARNNTEREVVVDILSTLFK